MHAHNDLLHFSAVGGISAGLAFLFLCASIAAQLPLTGLVVEQWRRAAPLLAALLGVFLAGLAQCYMLDDENVVVFWSLCALALRLRSTSSISAD